MPSSTELFTDLLDRSRLRAANWLFLLYLLYTLVTTLLSPQSLGDTLHIHLTRYLAAGLSALCLTLINVFPRSLQVTYLGVLLLLMLVAIQEIDSLTFSGTFPLHLSLWMMAHATLTFLIFGTRRGLWVLGGISLTLLAALLLHWPTDPYAAADWLTTVMTLLAAGGAGFTVMRLIEVNLLAHEQTTLALRHARTDTLTRLPGRATLDAELHRLLEQHAALGLPLSLAMCDIDHFKTVNDRWGHHRGDVLLFEFGQRLQALLEVEGGIVGRWGGEEFMVILPGHQPAQAARLLDDFRRSLERQPIARPPVTVSIGVSGSLDGRVSQAQLFNEADAAMYHAKQQGRNQVRQFQPDMTVRPLSLHALDADGRPPATP